MIRRAHQTMAAKYSGFTLIKLMAVTAIFGILLSVAFPVVRNYNIKAQTTEGVLLLSELRPE